MTSNFFEQIFWGNTIKQYCIFATILILGILFKRLVSRTISRLLFKLFDKFADNHHNQTFVDLLLKPFEFFITLTTCYLAVNQLSHPLQVAMFHYKNTVDKVKVNATFTIGEFLDKVFLFLIILSVFWIILRIIDFIAVVLLNRALKTNDKADVQLVPFLKELLKFIVAFIGFFVLLGYVFEVNAVSLITGLGIGGIAIAMAAKESLENLLGSFLIFMDKPFTVGDVVKVNGVEGAIEKVGFRSTIIRSTDKTTIVIPNRSMISGALENLTRRNFRRVKFSIGLNYKTPNQSIKNIITQITDYLKQHPKITDPAVNFEGFGDTALNIQILFLVSDLAFNDFVSVKQDVNFKIIDIVKANEADFTFPV
ncbi:mechanosensitive ion channel family protein [Pedobacter montanisoli]|uniref:Mechanosensitive ion channel family protein n=1 Tax=Pedobacter montanisoli TaxID=2923277 RepID=A0ABS9ZSG9_9SPHI|nr:mechanosensitive ion channel family protein [Pedobacter montanisoli]MCJ0741531.1 mechanosensitive ion channel family protein [Pedobacter montanisoli]